MKERSFASVEFTKGNHLIGFTLIELLVVLAIIGLISSLIFAILKSSRIKARDSRRIQEITQIAKAHQLYWVDNNQYSTGTCPCEKGGYNEQWEVSDNRHYDKFMEYLSPYLTDQIPLDPINTRVEDFKPFGPRPDNYFYAYKRYLPPHSFCPELNRPFVIIGISNLEFYVPSDLPQDNMPLPLSINLPRAVCGDPGPDKICTVDETKAGKCRDWSQEFDYSIMLIE